MNEAIEKLEDIFVRIQKLDYKNINEANSIKNRLFILLETILPEKVNYQKSLEKIDFAENIGVDLSKDTWISNQEAIKELVDVILVDLKLKERENVKNSENLDIVQKYEIELERIKNNFQKDLLLEKNKYRYLKKKYDIAQYNYENLKNDYQNILGKKEKWMTYLSVCFPLVFIILSLDVYFNFYWFNTLQYLVLVKTGLSFAVIAGFLYIPLKDKRLFLLSLLFLILVMVLQVI